MKRKLRMGMIGGGIGAFIGAVHRMAAGLDNEIELVCGAFALVLECMPPETARKITSNLDIPTIGIGAGPYCDAQILVTHDMLGFSGSVSPKFVKRYADLSAQVSGAVNKFKSEVEAGKFPAKEHCY